MMMLDRRIKFRGRHAGVPRGWVYGYFVKEDGDCYITNEDGKFPVIPDTVGQYIFKKDKYGKEIYEGDILKTDVDFWKIEVVNSIADFWKDYGYAREVFENTELEVIGNTYENPELLEGKNDRK